MPMIATTIISSIRVKPACAFLTIFIDFMVDLQGVCVGLSVQVMLRTTLTLLQAPCQPVLPWILLISIVAVQQKRQNTAVFVRC
jgi:hypothetical protein